MKDDVEVGVTVYANVLVSPIADMIAVAGPGRNPDTVETNWPLESVVPLAGENLTPPPPACVSATGIPAALFPPASLTITVRAAVDEPLSGNEVTGDVTSMIEPLIKIGICAKTPFARAMIVAVRVVISVEPEEKSTEPEPEVPVATSPGIRIPVPELNCIDAPLTTPPLASNAVTVMVALSELSDLIVATLRCSCKDATCAVAVGGGGVVVSGDFAPPPPQAAIKLKKDSDSRIFVKEANRLYGRLYKAALLIFTLRKCFKRIIAAHGRQH